MPDDKFYKFNHECDKMPAEVSFCHLNGSYTSQFSFDLIESGIGRSGITLYGFSFCPYCGKDMRDAD